MLLKRLLVAKSFIQPIVRLILDHLRRSSSHRQSVNFAARCGKVSKISLGICKMFTQLPTVFLISFPELSNFLSGMISSPLAKILSV